MKDEQKNGYNLSRQWFAFAFENQDKIKPSHGVLYFWIIELNNQLGWIETFKLPALNAMAAMGVSNYKTYKKAFDDLAQWGFIKIIEKSKNQHTANIIALVYFTKASPKQVQSTALSTAHVIKHINNKTIKTIKNTLPEKIPASPPSDFIDQIISEFVKAHGSYEILNKGKERAAASKLLQLYKKKYPGSNSAEILLGLGSYFKKCVNVQDPWLSNNMSLSIIVSKFNEINKILKNGNRKKGEGATPEELAAIVAENFGSDFKK